MRVWMLGVVALLVAVPSMADDDAVAEAASDAKAMVKQAKRDEKAAKKAEKAARKAAKKAKKTVGSDTDGDGVLNGDDACPLEAETVNSWKDDDGCPDQTATLLLVGRTYNAPVSGATATLSGDHTQVVTLDGPTAIPVPPEGNIEIQLSYQGCWTGMARVSLYEGPIIADIPLQKTGSCDAEVAAAD